MTMEGERNWSDDTTAHNRSAKIKTTTGMAHLPEEIMEEIFLRIPVKSLLKLKCVSKLWLSLISSPQFVKVHLELSNRNIDFTNHGIMFLSYDQDFKLKPRSISSLMSKSPVVASEDDYPNKSQCSTIQVVGSCNGIICIATHEMNIVLWNPSTRKSKGLPYMDVELMGDFYCTWGFGFSESEDDYKVVGIFSPCDDDHNLVSTDKCIVKIYSLRTDSWKRIEDFTLGIPHEETGKFASGKLHFESDSSTDVYKWNIVSLDLKSESYCIVNQPNYGEGFSSSCLGTFGGCLSIISDSPSRADVWVMKEYGVKESWIKVVSIPTSNLMSIDFKPLLIRSNGEILLRCDNSVVTYNPKDNCFTYSQISKIGELMESHIYVESLVPISAGRLPSCIKL